jgi:hypothetical protein
LLNCTRSHFSKRPKEPARPAFSRIGSNSILQQPNTTTGFYGAKDSYRSFSVLKSLIPQFVKDDYRHGPAKLICDDELQDFAKNIGKVSQLEQYDMDVEAMQANRNKTSDRTESAYIPFSDNEIWRSTRDLAERDKQLLDIIINE